VWGSAAVRRWPGSGGEDSETAAAKGTAVQRSWLWLRPCPRGGALLGARVLCGFCAPRNRVLEVEC
jgi:hypothetical protein